MARPPSPAAAPMYNSAKDLLEEIGKQVQQQATRSANPYKEYLHANLKQTKYPKDRNPAQTTPPYLCDLDYTKHTNVANGREDQNPCYGRQTVRFSDARSGQCTYNRIKDSENNNKVGACAPYRRLHVCDYNLENIDSEQITNTHNLLPDVLLAAKHEGESLVKEHEKYEKFNRDSKICTALARSFADIGDIIRGKDLFLGNKQEKEKLEENLKKIFGKLYENLNGENVKKHYKDETGNFYELREDWWALNREEIWNAITCKAPAVSGYFVYKLGNISNFSSESCGNNEGRVPTNLDYVPQFLRWFDEWADDFCRIRNHKLKNIKDACDDEKNGKYCSLNGYDCKKTSWKKGIELREYYCTGCFSNCSLYKIWVDNQKKEFEKQTKQFEKEINTYELNEGKFVSNINNKYHKEFYYQLKKYNYRNLESFLKLLNVGMYCKKKHIEEEDINFIKPHEKGTFSHSKVCKVCPDCGVICEKGLCKPKDEKYPDCVKKGIYTPGNENTTKINVIHNGDKEGSITQKLEDFCKDENNENGTNYEKWECYYVNSDNNRCKMDKNSGKSRTEYKITLFDEFFHLWVTNLLIDTINWDNELNNCINNTNVTNCDNVCNKNCKCFDKWVKGKEIEWGNVKNVLGNKNGTLRDYYNKLNKHFEGYFFHVMKEVNKEEKWNKLMENLKEKIDTSKENTDKQNSQGVIELLFEHLKEISDKCKDNNSNESCDTSPNPKTNPCGKNTSRNDGKLVTVKRLAELMQQEARTQLEERGGEIKLKGDAKLGKYELKRTASDLTDICKITENHSNSDPHESYEPCYHKDGEGTMFVMEYGWIPENLISTIHKDLHMPPRRRHFCTSNLENLNTGNTGLSDSKYARHSLLGDVLLAAKYEANYIKTKYKDETGFGDEATMCRAMKYSFADLGDIIKGTDLWDQNPGEIKTQDRFKTIFGTLLESLKKTHPTGAEKYDKDDEKHTKLREDWWEANRHHVWRAMKCAMQNGNIAKCNGIPIEDYIPQKLRWLTEWAEWYCKAQKEAYKELEKKCKECKDYGQNCTKQSGDVCTKCTKAYEEYNDKIEPWRNQWENLKQEYTLLYGKAKTAAINGGTDNSTATNADKDKNVIDFLQKLHEANGGTRGPPSAMHPSKSVTTRDKRDAADTKTTYDNIGAYLHDTGNFDDCQKQNVFCDSGDNYAFKETPPEFDVELHCKSRPKSAPEKAASKKTGKPKMSQKEEKDVCDKADGELKDKDSATQLHGCKTKDYNGWNCDRRSMKKENEGACMPPRRIKLCINDLENMTTESQDKLREAFINCAIMETHFAWLYYKKQNKTAQAELQSGKIPDGFKRIMYYSYGDYKDLLFGTDISRLNYNTTKVKERIDNVFKDQKSKGKRHNNETREKFWEENKNDIWYAMVCALGHDVNAKVKGKIKESGRYSDDVEKFAKTPQFLRWFTEWSDYFCAEQAKRLVTLKENCPVETCNADNSKKNQCKTACEKYKEWLKEWKDKYKIQSAKFDKDKTNNKYKQDPTAKDAHNASSARDYLNKALINLCPNGTCSCMNDSSREPKQLPDGNTDMPSSLDDTPSEYKQRCKCPEAPPKKEEEKKDACTIVNSLLHNKKATDPIDGCNQKSDANWDCDPSTFVNDNNNGACMPPRRIKLCIYYLENHTQKGNIKKEFQLREAFIKCAGAEIFLLWQKYKTDNNSDTKLQTQLESGQIPEEFKRRMFYTFGDFRDLCLGNDIGKADNTKNISGTVTSILKNESNDQILGECDEDKRKNWWKTIEKDMWESMVCGLSHHISTEKVTARTELTKNYNYKTVRFSGENSPTLEKFAQTPQFLRWLTEWGEDFCKERNGKVKELEEKCGKCNVSDSDGSCERDSDGCKKCTKECETYQGWLEKWKENYNKQKDKFLRDKSENNYDHDPVAKNSEDAREYLEKTLQKFCQNGSTNENCDYKCMNEVSKKPSSDGNRETIPASLEYPPKEINGKCDCQQKEATPPPKVPEVPTVQDDVCNIVDKELTGDNNLNAACNLKYGGNNSRLGWKCIPSGEDTSTGGSICVPPRRRKLYTQKIKEWAEKNTAVSSETPQDDTASQSDKLRTAFIQSAAVETFFLWDKYKMDKEIEEKEKKKADGKIYTPKDGKEEAQKELERGDIPEEFKRQMFYTLGDYRDILFGKDIGGGDNIEKVKENINKVFPNRTSDGKQSGDNQRSEWWQQHGKDIWQGMLCALTYKEKDKKIERNSEVEKKLMKKLKSDYKYDNVSFKGGFDENNGTDSLKPDVPPSPETKLETFVKRPFFFRWLEEWGEEFCRKRTHKLYIIEKDCRGRDGDEKCSGDGLNCKDTVPNKKDIFKPFYCPSCGKSCRFYKMWINTKKKEFEKLKGIYTREHDSAKLNNHDSTFSGTLKSCTTAADLLERLKNGPCKNNNDNGEEHKIDFNDTKKTFRHAEYCDPCSEFKINCKNGKCSNGDGTKGKCDGKTAITSKEIEQMKENIQLVDMYVSDKVTKEFDSDLGDCRDAGTFEGIRKDVWKCGNVCGVDICTLEKKNNNAEGKEHIIVKELIKRWLEYFFEDYYKINKKLNSCIQNGYGEETKCISGCKKNCECVEKWVKEKKKEWNKIKEHYIDQYKKQNDGGNTLTNFLEILIPETHVKKATGHKKIRDFESKVCNCPENSKKKGGKENNIVLCLLDMLEKKATPCLSSTSDSSETPCENPSTTLDDEESLEETEENTEEAKKMIPKFCEGVVQIETAEEETDGNCEEAPPSSGPEEVVNKEKEDDQEASGPAAPTTPSEEVNPEEAIEPPSEKTPVKPAKPKDKRRKQPKPRKIVDEHPLLKHSLMSSTLMWSVGISFAAISYFLLKKKSKSSVDLLRVLNIPKGDYGMPTLKSKNRYIPYRSGTYKGKTYIYMEGDTSGDEDKYIWDLSSSDITSSESEYEEMDINDIYPYTSPEYKTLIEVVLEPSKSNGNTLGDDIVPTTNTFTDEEWNELKNDFISQYLPNTEPNNNYRSGDIPMSTEPNTLYFDKPEEKPFITSIHDRDLYTGEEINYNINMVNNDIPMSDKNGTYTGIDLINDTLSGEPIDIYDEVLKRKENELFGTKHPKRTSNNSVAKNSNSDPIDNQLDLFHTWLDRHRDMCEQWNNKEDILNKLNEEWNKDNDRGNVPIDNKTLNTNVSIQIDMDHGKPKKEFTNMDTNVDTPTKDSILDDLETYNEPFYDIYEDDVYYDVNDDNKTSTDHNNLDVSSKVQIEMDVNSKSVKEKYPISDVWDI